MKNKYPAFSRAFGAGLVLSAGLAVAGGYVDGVSVLTQAQSIPQGAGVSTVPTFNNATLNDRNTIGETNNNLLKTPSTSDPISTVTGNNFHDETDFVIRGRGINYAFTRTFNSAPSSTSVRGALGFGWTHSYAMRLKSNDYGNCPNCTSTQAAINGNSKTASITYTDERGGDHLYLVNETNQAVTMPQGEFDTLTLDSPSAGLNTVTFRSGVKYIFQTVGSNSIKTVPAVTARLHQIVDPWGNQLNFGYDTAGRLATVRDNLGITTRTGLVFTYASASSPNLRTIKDWTGRTWTYVVDGSGNLATYQSPQALTTAGATTMKYGYVPGTHNLQIITKPLKRNNVPVQVTFAYYENGRTFTNRDALGFGETLDYDLYRKSTSVTDFRGNIRTYVYDESGRLTKLTEPDGGVLFFTNNADGLRATKTDGIGYKTQYSYRSDKAFACPAGTGGSGQPACSNTGGNVTREQDALSQIVDMTYGIYDQVATVKDKRGTIRTTTFHTTTDATCAVAGKPKRVTISALTIVAGTVKANVPLLDYCWHADGAPRTMTEYLDPNSTSRKRVTTYTYSDATHLNVDNVTVVGWDNVSTSKSFTYDSLGRVKTETLRRRNSSTDATLVDLVTTYTYDNLDRTTQVQDALGNIAITGYDDNGQARQVTHQYKKPDGTFDIRNIVTRTFDAADRVATETDALGGVAKFAYDAAGSLVSRTDPLQNTVRYEYDPMGRLTATIDANGNRATTRYNARGDIVASVDATGYLTSYVYDAIGRLTSVTEPHGYTTQYAYDANSNVTCTIDANAQGGLQPKNSDGCSLTRQFDELNRPLLVRDAANGTTATTYDLQGNPLTRIDAEGRKYTWTYDGLGRLKSETDFTGKLITYSRDEAGNIWQRKNRLNEVSRYDFDYLGRHTKVSYLKDSTSEQFVYDPASNLVSSSNGVISYGFSYDNLNRLKTKTDSRGKSLAFTYDAAGNILTKTTYQGSTTSYVYDSANRLIHLSSPDYLSVNYQYDPAGRLLTRILGGGARSVYSYDTKGWLSRIQHYDAAGASVYNTSFGRDRVGNITSAASGSSSTTYTLDALYRLTVVDAPNTADDEAFSYDHVGNRLTATQGGTVAGAAGATTRHFLYFPATATGSPGSAYMPTYGNRLKEVRLSNATGAIDASFTYDDEGRMLARGGINPMTFAWDAKGRLATLTKGAVTERFFYDTTNHRIQRSGGALGMRDYYLEGDHLESVYSGNVLKEKYFRGITIDELVAGYTDATGTLTPYQFEHDQVMSVVAATKANGGKQETLTYRAFGETRSSTGTLISRLKYTGREDDGTGLYQYRARYYDPMIGRFISEDPLGLSAGENLYAYVGNNPINANDPDGLLLNFVGGALANVVIGGAVRAATGGDVLDASAILMDLAIGAATSGAGAIAQIRHTRQILNAERATGRVVGTAQSTGTMLHAARTEQEAVRLLDAGADVVYLNRAYSTATGVKGAGALNRPDAIGVFPGRVAAVEVASKTDDVAALAARNNTAMTNTGLTGSTSVVETQFSFRLSDDLTQLFGQRTVGAAPLDMTGVGAAYTFGGQAAYQTGQAAYQGAFSDVLGAAANGGFLLYPNKPNNNMMGTVYSK